MNEFKLNDTVVATKGSNPGMTGRIIAVNIPGRPDYVRVQFRDRVYPSLKRIRNIVHECMIMDEGL